MELCSIERALLAPELRRNWEDTLAEWTEAAPGQAEAILDRMVSVRDEFLQAARDIDDPETLDMVAAIRYIEMKSHWIMLNTQVNYITVFKGETDLGIAYQASLVSQLLEALEKLIDEQDVHRIIEFLSEPLTLRES